MDDTGELVCLNCFPCQPLYLWQDNKNLRYHESYFSRYSQVWTQGD